MQVLVALARAEGEVVSRDELIASCWGGLAIGDDAINRCIGRLRRLAEAEAPDAFTIETLPRIGYRLERSHTKEAPARQPATAPRRRITADAKTIAAGGVVVAALAAVIVAFTVWLTPSPTLSRVAVAPLEPLSSGDDVRYLGVAIADEVLGVLASNQGEAVSRDEAARLKGDDTAAARLGVGLLVNGSVSRDSAETMVSVRLEDARSHVALWSADFERPNPTASDLRLEVAAKVADIIEVAQYARASKPALTNDAALSALLEAHDSVRWGRRESWAHLLEVARKPVQLAPDFAFGHSMLANAEAFAVKLNAMPDRTAELTAGVRREAARALQIDPRQSLPYVVLASIEPQDAFRETEALLRKGLAVEGRPAMAYAAVMLSESELLHNVGRPSAALPLDEQALAVDRLSPVKYVNLIQSYAEAGRIGPAEDLLAQGLQRWPNQPDMRLVRLYVAVFYGPPDAALSLLEDPIALPEMTPRTIAAWRAFLLAKQGKAPTPAAGRDIVSADDSGELDPAAAILMLSSLGETDRAFDQANKAQRKVVLEPRYLFTQQAAAMRRDPRFWRLAKRVGLVDYWRATGEWPEFCAKPGLPYDCKIEAAKVA